MAGQSSLERMHESLVLAQPSRALVRRELARYIRRLVFVAAFLTTLLFAGAVAFAGFESTSYWTGIQRALTTISTLGSMGEPHTIGGQVTEGAAVAAGAGTPFFLPGAGSEPP